MSFSTFSTENLMNLLSQSLVSSALQPPYFFLQSSQVNTSDRLMIVFETTPLFDNKTTKFWNSLTLIFSICEIILPMKHAIPLLIWCFWNIQNQLVVLDLYYMPLLICCSGNFQTFLNKNNRNLFPLLICCSGKFQTLK